MFFDIGWPEFLLIGIVALVVIGPKDLPAALRVAGYWVRKARSLSREFHSSVEQMMREVELHEVQNELRKATEIDLDREFNKIVDPAAAAQPAEIPDYLDPAPAPADPITADPLASDSPAPDSMTDGSPPPAVVEIAEEPELPMPVPEPLASPDGEPQAARLEPPKP
jgi:sec-independent protein translocase protein TatB